MKKILFASDFSESCQNALDYVKGLINKSEITIDFMHVYDVSVKTLSALNPVLAEAVITERKQDIKDKLQDQLDQLPEKNRGEIHAIYGLYPSTEIADLANTLKSDLIIMALRQKYSLVDRLIGTVTAHTFAKSNIPVLAIPNGAAFTGIKNILLPISYDADTLSVEDSQGMQLLTSIAELTIPTQIHLLQIKQMLNDDIKIALPFDNTKLNLLYNDDIDEGIRMSMTTMDIGLLAIHHKNRPFWERLYHSNLTRKLLFKARTPLVIF